jgi:tetratricopeptide (TPR) repeat protein
LYLGIAHSNAGDGEAGLAAIAHAVRLSPRDLFRNEFDLFRAFAYFQIGDYAKAAEYAAEAASLRPGHAFVYLIEAARSALDGDQERAEMALGRLMALIPGFGLEAAATQIPYIRDDDHARFVSGLRRAGLAP